MRRTSFLFLATLVALAGCGGDDPVSTEPAPGSRAALARMAFDALKSGDASILDASLPTASDMTWMLEEVREAATPEKVAEIEGLVEHAGGVDGMVEERAAQARTAFDAARKLAASDFDWAKTEFVEMVEERSLPVEENGLEGATVHFLVRAGEQDALFRVRSCVKLDGVWKTLGGVGYVASPHRSRQEALTRQTQKHIRAVETVIQMFKADHHGRMPTGMEELFGDSPRTKSPYLVSDFADSWGNPFTLDFPTPETYRIRSNGPDGVLDTDDDLVWPLPEAEED